MHTRTQTHAYTRNAHTYLTSLFSHTHTHTRAHSIAGEELTPTMKLRRPIVSKMYDAVIESMYADAGGEA